MLRVKVTPAFQLRYAGNGKPPSSADCLPNQKYPAPPVSDARLRAPCRRSRTRARARQRLSRHSRLRASVHERIRPCESVHIADVPVGPLNAAISGHRIRLVQHDAFASS
jgi:hypothetical protein